jgi:Ser/Thr protein kinase RdoA (MazF antagonist)
MPPPSPDIALLSEALPSMVGVPARIDALPSGTTGRSYLVETVSGCYVAKVFDPESGALLGPAEQFELLRALADARIAPAPVGFDRAAGLLVTRFLEGAIPLDPSALRRPDNTEKVVRCLRRLHEIEVAIPPFAPLVYARRYVRMAGGLMSLSDADRERYAELVNLGPLLDGLPACVCHNDLVAENLLIRGDVALIDFDYAVMAPAVLDLASLAVMNGFTEPEARGLIDSYYGERSPFSAAEFARVQRLVRLLAHFWALASGDTGAAIVSQYRMTDD